MTEPTNARRPDGGPRARGCARGEARGHPQAIVSLKFHWEIDEYKTELAAGLKRIDDDDRLRHLLERAVRCVSLYDFHQSLLPTSKLAARIAPEVRREIIADWARQVLRRESRPPRSHRSRKRSGGRPFTRSGSRS